MIRLDLVAVSLRLSSAYITNVTGIQQRLFCAYLHSQRIAVE